MHCADGGTRLDIGVDADGSGELEASEIDDTVYACDVTASGGGGSAGGACTPGTSIQCYDGLAAQLSHGLCAAGTKFCNGDGLGYGPCTGQVLPGTETCDGVDNDCDGRTDERGVVISAVMPTGGTNFPYDYVELRNLDGAPADLFGTSVQYASANGTTWSVIALPAVTIPPFGFLLVQTTGTSTTPAADVVGSLNLAASAGKVAFVGNTTPLIGACPGGALSLVPYGATTGCGTGTALPSDRAFVRRNGGCLETGSVSNDFAVATAAPRSLASGPLACTCEGASNDGANESGLAGEVDVCQLVTTSVSATQGNDAGPVVVSMYEAGVSDRPDPTEPPPGVTVEIGYGPSSADPRLGTFTWFAAAFQSQISNNDYFSGYLMAPPSGAKLHVAARVNLGGLLYTYCDLDGAGSNAGLDFSPSNLPVFSVTTTQHDL